MTKVGWWTTDWHFEEVAGGKKVGTFGGTGHYRLMMPAVELNKHGWDCVRSPALRAAPDGHLQVMGVDGVWHDDCDVVVFQRWMASDGAELARRAQACGQKVVNDVDDNFWALPKSNMAYHTTDPRKNPNFNREFYWKMLEASDALWCSTQAIADTLEALDVPVTILRNAIDLYRWKTHDPGVNGMVGWIGGVPWRDKDLPLLNGTLGPFLKKYGLPFYHGGDFDDPSYPKAWEQLGLNPHSVRICTNPIVPIDRYPELWDPVNLMIIPLADTLFNRSKSWLKGLEAAACGIPFIASRLPEYELLGIGLLADNRREWREHLDFLLDPWVRRAEGAINRARAEQLDIRKQWVNWDAALKELGVRPKEEAVV